jgi:hypothetical protein
MAAAAALSGTVSEQATARTARARLNGGTVAAVGPADRWQSGALAAVRRAQLLLQTVVRNEVSSKHLCLLRALAEYGCLSCRPNPPTLAQRALVRIYEPP